MLISESIARDIFRLIIWYPFRGVIRILPVAWCFVAFRLLGRIHYLIFPGKNHLLAENLKLALGQRLSVSELKDIIIKYYENHYADRLQILLFPRLNKHNIEKIHSFEGLENLEHGLRQKHGCILLHAHLGPAQLPLCALGAMGYSVVQIGLPSYDNPNPVGRLVFRLRQRYEAQLKASIISAKSFLRPVLLQLKNNGIIMVTGDGAGGVSPIGRYARFNFLHHQLHFALGAFSLAQKTGAQVLPLFTVIGEDKKYRTIIESPIAIDYSLKDEQVFIKQMAVFVNRLEGYVSRQPYLWHFWDEFTSRIKRDSALDEAG